MKTAFTAFVLASSISATSQEVASTSPAQVQLDAREYAAAIHLAGAQIAQLEGHSLYDPQLVEPLVVLGDALLASDDATGAIFAYERARQVIRTNDGLYAPRQVDVLYREAEAYQRAGDLVESNHRQEYAYHLNLRHGRSADLISPQLRLAQWYESTGHLTLAQELYDDAILLAGAYLPDDKLLKARLLRKLGGAHQLQRFPPYRFEPGLFVPRPDGRVWRDLRYDNPHLVPFDDWRRGQRALEAAVETIREQRDSNYPEVTAAMLDLADWLLLFHGIQRASDTYAQVYRALEAKDPGMLKDVFARPTLLYLPFPGHPERAMGSFRWLAHDGSMELSISVDAKGRPRNVQTVRVEPKNDLLATKYRRVTRRARYRPAFVDAKPVSFEDVTVVHTFEYYRPD